MALPKATSLVTVIAALMLPAIAVGLTQGSDPIDPEPVKPTEVECGEETGIDYEYDDDYFAFNYPSGTAACRAALQGLRDLRVAAANVKCKDDGCDPGTCIPKIRCDTADCDELTYGPAVENPPGSNQWQCTAAYDGKYGVLCTDCSN